MRFCLLLLLACTLRASSTAAWEMNTFQDFLRGRFSGVSLSRDGRITLAPKMDALFASEQPYIWSVAEDGKGAFYVGTGHRGRVYRVDASGKSSLVWTSTEPEVFALAVAPDGAVFAATSPDGKIYRITGGKAAVYFEPHARYIWTLAIGHDNALYAGTGDGGKVFRITAANTGEVYYDTGQSNVTALAVDAKGNLLAGTDPNGMLYRISAKDKAFVLYDANLPEIRTIAVAADGIVYAAALGGSVAQRANAANGASQSGSGVTQVTAPATTITVTDEAAMQGGLEVKPKPVDPAKQEAAAQPAVYTAPVEMAGVEKSAIFRVLPDNTVETLWSSKEENIYDILLSSANLLFSTDQHGRIYRMTPDRRVTLLAQTTEGETIRLAAAGTSFVAATGTMGKLYRLNEGYGNDGVYESPVHDAGSVARWGQISWRGERIGTAKLSFQTRSGNSARPDRTWSEWSEPVSELRGSNVASPNARFVQWRAAFGGGGTVSPSVTSVALSYLPQNNAPVVKSLNVSAQLAAATSPAKTPAQSQPATGTYSITVTDTGEAGASSLSGTATQTVSRGISQQIQIVWQAEDADGDRLVYALYFRAEDESNWKLLRASMAESAIILEGDVFADGKYLFRIVASDKPSNAGASAREAELVSAPVQFDNTPPVVTIGAPRRAGSAVEIDVQASDTSSSLRRAEYSVDAGSWQPLEASDGVIDGHIERFAVHLDHVAQGEHLVVVRAYDASNNAGLAKIVIR